MTESALAGVQDAKGDDEARPWGTDVLQAYMDKQLGKECAPPPLLDAHPCVAVHCPGLKQLQRQVRTLRVTKDPSGEMNAFKEGARRVQQSSRIPGHTAFPADQDAGCLGAVPISHEYSAGLASIVPERLWLCRPRDDEQGGGGKIIAGMPMGPAGTNGSHGTNGTHGGSETEGLISGRKTSR